MPTVKFPNMTLTTTDNAATKIRVTYSVEFSEIERNLAGLGLLYHDHIVVVGVDGTVDTPLLEDSPNFGTRTIAVTPGAGVQSLDMDRTIVVARSLLQEDSGAGDTDEIRCKIRIHAEGFPAEWSPDAFTNQRTIAN
jgi:hypothetical protein